MAIGISADMLATMRPSKTFTQHTDIITSIDFDDTGEWAITSSKDLSLNLWDCKLGKHNKTLYSKKYGVHLARFTHHSTNVVYSSTLVDDTLRYLSLHDNSFIRYFKGHAGRVNSLEICPANDLFLSTAADNTARLWDLRSASCQGLLNIPGPNLGAFDPSGIIFAVLSQSLNTLLLYDLRNFDKEPFSEFSLSDDSFLQKFSFPARMPEFQRLEFTNDGKHIFVGTTGKVHYSIHSFEGNIVSRMIGHEPVETAELNAGNSCVTPDGRYALAASNDRQIMVWDLHRKTPEVRESKSISTKSVGICDLVAFNHKSALMVTTSKEALTFWLPDASVS